MANKVLAKRELCEKTRENCQKLLTGIHGLMTMDLSVEGLSDGKYIWLSLLDSHMATQ